MTFPCKNCAKEVGCAKCIADLPWHHFCSDACAEEWYGSWEEALRHDWCIGWNDHIER
jgi:hypothetical protein